MLRLNIGCGSRILDGYNNVDVCHFPGVDTVAPAHYLPFADESVSEVLVEHLIEHLTYFEANQALEEWHRVLKPGGMIIIECPDLLGLCQQFVEANEYKRYQTNRGHWPVICHIYGHQRGKNKEEMFAQVHKSGYTFEHLRSMLEGMGFERAESLLPLKDTPGSCVIRVSAIKRGSK